jgi:serine/threonine protein kinase
MTDRYVYKDTAEIGAGAFGKVRVAHDSSLDRDVAVKSLDPLLRAFSDAEQERFKREARTLAKLSHPNIPAVYDVEFTSDKFNIYFQFIEGQNLRKVIEANGPTQIGVVRQWFQQIASALEHAHKLGIIHRDIKPENIIITPDMQTAYLVDFGIAISSEEAKRLTETGYVIGTPGYMAPEQLNGDTLDARADIFALGVTLYEVLAGQRMVHGDYKDLSVNEAIPSAIDDLVLSCIEGNRDQRLANARLFSTALSAAFAQPNKPLSDVLAHGRLHELGLVIQDYDATSFNSLPAGQRVLILAKVSDVVGSNDRNLNSAAEGFLELLVTRGILLGPDEYREIVKPAIQWAFEKEFDQNIGRGTIRRALESAAFEARDGAFNVLTEEALGYLQSIDLDEKQEWYLHAMREFVQTLMANPECGATVAVELGRVFREINRAQRSRPRAARFAW